MTLAEFYAARLDEDEAAARAATPGEWAALDGGVMSVENESWPVSSTESARNREDRVHIARHDPARVLREVEAKRKILAAYEEAAEHPFDLPEGVHDGRDQWERERDAAVLAELDGVVRYLAEVDSDHPDYQQAWRP